jgi:hypothetical protein
MDLTPDILRAAYAYLAETPPFDGWHMPDAEDVKFEVIGGGGYNGWCEFPWKATGQFRIQISGKYHKHSVSTLRTVAHEMVHVHMFRTKMGMRHGKVFKALAAEVCAAHGFDPGEF